MLCLCVRAGEKTISPVVQVAAIPPQRSSGCFDTCMRVGALISLIDRLSQYNAPQHQTHARPVQHESTVSSSAGGCVGL